MKAVLVMVLLMGGLIGFWLFGLLASFAYVLAQILLVGAVLGLIVAAIKIWKDERKRNDGGY